MQLMPATWAEMRRIHGLGADPDNPRDNVLAGTAYLRAMYDQFGYPGLFAAYNTGPDRYARHLETGAPLPRETIAYLAQLTGVPNPGARAVHGTVPTERSPIFAIHLADAPWDGSVAAADRNALFVILPPRE
jgi:hypothetical protein